MLFSKLSISPMVIVHRIFKFLELGENPLKKFTVALNGFFIQSCLTMECSDFSINSRVIQGT